MPQVRLDIPEDVLDEMERRAEAQGVSVSRLVIDLVQREAGHGGPEVSRRSLLEDSNRAYRELRSNPEAWQEIESERAVWDATLSDGLPDDRWDAEPNR